MTETLCPPDHKHGESSTCYCLHKCRCGECRQRNTDYSFWRKQHLRAGHRPPGAVVTGPGTRRRIEALMCLGWSGEKIAEHIGTDHKTLWRWKQGGDVSPATYARVARAYEELWDKHPPEPSTKSGRISVRKTTELARKRRYLPPLAWDDIDNDDAPAVATDEVLIDEIAVELAVRGEHPKLNSAERRLVVPRLWEKRWSDARIGAYIDVDARTVLRIRQELELPGWPYEELDLEDRWTA